MRGSLLAVFTPPLVGRLHSGNTCACIHKYITPLTPTRPLLAVVLTAEEQALYKEAHAKSKAIFQQYLTLGHAQVLQGALGVWRVRAGVGCLLQLGVQLRNSACLGNWSRCTGAQWCRTTTVLLACTLLSLFLRFLLSPSDPAGHGRKTRRLQPPSATHTRAHTLRHQRQRPPTPCRSTSTCCR